MTGQRNPDIQRLLANLRSGYLQGGDTQPQGASQNDTNKTDQQPPFNPTDTSIPGLGLLPPAQHQPQASALSRSLTPQPTPQPAPRPITESNKDRSATPVIPDASTITTWPAALKHVTKHIASNDKAVGKIKQLISEQHKHEQQWWTNREAIVARQSGRAGNQAKVADLLKSLGGATVPITAHNPEADQAELDAYDKKVYKGLLDMAADFDRQLRSLQIPFFAIKHELVILDEGTQKEGSKGKIDRGELRELQRRMIETLEDLFGDD